METEISKKKKKEKHQLPLRSTKRHNDHYIDHVGFQLPLLYNPPIPLPNTPLNRSCWT
jgi:hypothetical protein